MSTEDAHIMPVDPAVEFERNRIWLANFIVTREEWMDWAACIGLNPNIFFPTRGETTDSAKAVCRTCPVGSECDAYASKSGSQYGVWNGKTRSRSSK